MKKNTIYTIVAVAILLSTVFISAIVVGLIDNPLSPNRFIGTWIATAHGKEGSETWTFKRPMLGQWGTGTSDGWPFEYKYTTTKLIVRFLDPTVPPRFGVVTTSAEYYTADYYFIDSSTFILTVDGLSVTFVKIA